MNKFLVLPAVLAMGLLAGGSLDRAEAKPGGCIKGAAVGGAAGHLAHHGVLGAVAGCAIGMHRRHVYNREMRTQGNATVVQH